MIFSNDEKHGGSMLDVVQKELKSSNDVCIASGYVSNDIIGQFENDFYRISKNGGAVKLLVGMAFYEGLAGQNLMHLKNIETNLRKIRGDSGIFVCFTRRFHGKIYSFKHSNDDSNVFVGSSNFSRSGLSENLECTAKIQDPESIKGVQRYLDYLFSSENAKSILKADITVLGSKQYIERISLKTLGDLKKYDTASIDKSGLPSFSYPLGRIVASEKSSLNVYFGKGRENKKTKIVRPRDWYEVELIATSDINRNPIYPKGDFLAYTDDGYVIPMKTSGDYFKNIRSKNNLKILGQWIKGKMQKKGALIPLTPVTQETLDKYGNDSIRFYKIQDGKYYMEF